MHTGKVVETRLGPGIVKLSTKYKAAQKSFFILLVKACLALIQLQLRQQINLCIILITPNGPNAEASAL